MYYFRSYLYDCIKRGIQPEDRYFTLEAYPVQIHEAYLAFIYSEFMRKGVITGAGSAVSVLAETRYKGSCHAQTRRSRLTAWSSSMTAPWAAYGTPYKKAAATASAYREQVAGLTDSMAAALCSWVYGTTGRTKKYTELIMEYYEAWEALNDG